MSVNFFNFLADTQSLIPGWYPFEITINQK
ncbi:hypothetical protein SAMN04488505_10180 [Chitinophaga rupis]|uniref:Uncharacterized protein n=1 Tax=Chitinophaga rupis TaxID=573321 RepID=A0A1H7GJK5_9BACT|nr:hypothetical protein SAMN04488505_10180 [Chitinophaga rupis]